VGVTGVCDTQSHDCVLSSNSWASHSGEIGPGTGLALVWWSGEKCIEIIITYFPDIQWRWREIQSGSNRIYPFSSPSDLIPSYLSLYESDEGL
jgi:hypothetical protein